MFRISALLLSLCFLAAADDWTEFKSGPYEVWTNTGGKEARETLSRLEQLRYVLGTAVGKPQSELKTTWPVRILMFKNAPATPPALARDTFTGSLAPNAPMPREWLRALVVIFLESDTRRMSEEIESGLAAFYSTMQVDGAHVVVGAPVPPAERTQGWAKIHLLQTDPRYSGKIRVLLSNLQQGVDPEAAYFNAFAKKPADIDREAAAHLASGNFGTWEPNSKPISAQRDFRPSYQPPTPAPALADLKLVMNAADARTAYLALRNESPAAGHEGLGLIALKEKRTGEARQEFAAAAAAGSTSARAWLEYARLETDAVKQRAAIAQAEKLNPNWAEPYRFLAQLETDPLRKMQALDKAAKLAQRDAGLWRELAEACQNVNKYPEAAKAWVAAEHASVNPAERESILQARRAIEEKRLEWQEAERKRLEAEREKDLRDVREKALAEVRAAEARANAGAPPPPPDRKIVPMFEGEAPQGRVRGHITAIECKAPSARFVIQLDDGKTVRLNSRDPSQLLVFGPGAEIFKCGPQKPPRLAAFEYFPKDDPKTGTAGEVATIEYFAEQAPAADAPKESPERKTLGRP